MNTRLNNFIPDTSKIYTIRYNNKNHPNLYNVIFGRADKPYFFTFLKIAENHYVLSRQKDGQVLCFDNDRELKMSDNTTDLNPLVINPMKYKQGNYALSVKSQQMQGYICYDGIVLHEYYIASKTVESVEEAAIWSINEVPNDQLTHTEESQTKHCKAFELN